MSNTSFSVWIGAVALSMSATSAHAHIDLDAAGTHLSRYGAAQIKQGPCGMTGGTRGTNVYTYRPGETITIKLHEYVAHPGYFRIAFDPDGDDDFENPSGLDPQFGACNAGDPNCGPGKADFCNNETVLLDYLSPHASVFGQAPTYTWSVTLPNVECDNCTLQIIQVMEDLVIHGTAYAPDDLYYQCIDLVLSNDAPEVDDQPMTNDGMVCSGVVVPSVDAGVSDGGPAAGAGGAGGIGGTGGGGGLGGAGGVGGMDSDAGVVGGIGGGAAGMSGPVGGAGGTSGGAPTGGNAGTPGGAASSGESDSGCRAAGAGSSHGLALLLALVPLFRARRKRA